LIALSYGPLFLEALPNTNKYYVSWEQYTPLNIYQLLRVKILKVGNIQQSNKVVKYEYKKKNITQHDNYCGMRPIAFLYDKNSSHGTIYHFLESEVSTRDMDTRWYWAFLYALKYVTRLTFPCVAGPS
jgi:hypothetical protein